MTLTPSATPSAEPVAEAVAGAPTGPSSASGLLLGIDTGGTYTDAVVYDERTSTVVAKAKAPTTHHDLAIGILGAIDAAMIIAGVEPARIELVSLSTTLATNALVEGKGRPVAAVIIGFDDAVLQRAGLSEALAGDPAILIAGGHDSHGSEVAPLDLTLLEAQVRAVAPLVDSFAVVAQFSVRNPDHELVTTELIRRVTGRPVTASHTLSAKLNGPKRAVTAVLNARLIPIIDGLVATTERTLHQRGVTAPLMVVRGDGSLVSAAFVRERPIETILSGPAASLVGAAHLTGLTDAIISDIGGTTTDIAVLRSGTPLISQDGATVGGHRTMVSAVAMHTHGLGGDSEVRHDDRVSGAVLLLGPRRVVPVSLLALDHPDDVHETLDRQLAADPPSDLDGVFVVLADRALADLVTDDAERRVMDAMRSTVTPALAVMSSLVHRRIVERLVRRGVLQLSSFTPTDANHVLGGQLTFDRNAARKVSTLFARRRDRLGKAIAADATAMAELTIQTLVRRSAEAVLAAAFDHDGLPPSTVASAAVQAALDGRLAVVRLPLGLHVPLIGLGASAPSYYPAVAALAGTESVIPRDADVANAVGAVVGRVRIEHRCVISAQQGQYIVHAGATPEMFTVLERAVTRAIEIAGALLHADMAAAGAPVFETSTDWREVSVEVGGTPMFVEGELTLTGSGRPEVAR